MCIIALAKTEKEKGRLGNKAIISICFTMTGIGNDMFMLSNRKILMDLDVAFEKLNNLDF